MDKLKLTIEAIRSFPEDKSEVVRWFEQFEAIAKAIGLPDTEWKAAIILKMKPDKFLQVSLDLQNANLLPDNEEAKTYNWLKESLINMLGEERTLQQVAFRLVRKRLLQSENLNHYRTEFDILWNEFLTTFEAILAIENAGERKKKLDREKNEFFISGLPPEI